MGRFKNYFNNLLAQDMARQVRRVQAVTLVVFLLLLATVWWLSHYRLELTVPTAGGGTQLIKLNVFQLLFSK